MASPELKPVHYEIFDPTYPMHQECEGVLNEWRQAHFVREQAKATTDDDIVPAMLELNLSEHSLGVMVFESQDAEGANADTLRSYNAVRKLFIDDEALEIGGLITEPANGEKTKKGWAWAVKPELYRQIGMRWDGWRMIIFANAKSLKLNSMMGFQPMADEHTPQAAIDDCMTCPNFEKVIRLGRSCCDTQIHRVATTDNLDESIRIAVSKSRGYGIAL